MAHEYFERGAGETTIESGAVGTTFLVEPSQPPPPIWPPTAPHQEGSRPIPLSSSGLRILVQCLLVGITFDVVWRAGFSGIAGALLALALGAAAFFQRDLRHVRARTAAATCGALGLLLVVRSTAWLVPLNALAAFGSLAFAAGIDHGRLASLSCTRLLIRIARFAAAPFTIALSYLVRATRAAIPSAFAGRRQNAGAVLRGLVIALPVVLVLGALLTAGDAVFASIFSFSFNGWSLTGHAIVVGLGAVAAAGVLADIARGPDEPLRPAKRWLGQTEATLLLGAIALLYAIFAATQIVVLAAGADHVLEAAGLTYAEYARSGFFQLLAVAVLTIAILLGVRSQQAERGGVIAALSGAIAILSIGIVFVSIRRLMFYEDAFGLTMLRLYSTTFAWWLGAVFVILGIDLVRRDPRGRVLINIGASALALLIAVNLVNPEALVASRNLDRSADGMSLDLSHLLLDLGDDAVPTVAGSIDELNPVQARIARAHLCQRAEQGDRSIWSWTLSRSAANQAARAACAG